jgi:hypothetical protein
MLELEQKLRDITNWDEFEVGNNGVKFNIKDCISFTIYILRDDLYEIYSEPVFQENIKVNTIDSVIHIVNNWLMIQRNLYYKTSTILSNWDESRNPRYGDYYIMVDFYLLKFPDATRKVEWKTAYGLLPKKRTKIKYGLFNLRTKFENESDVEQSNRIIPIVEESDIGKYYFEWIAGQHDEEIESNRINTIKKQISKLEIQRQELKDNLYKKIVDIDLAIDKLEQLL